MSERRKIELCCRDCEQVELGRMTDEIARLKAEITKLRECRVNQYCFHSDELDHEGEHTSQLTAAYDSTVDQLYDAEPEIRTLRKLAHAVVDDWDDSLALLHPESMYENMEKLKNFLEGSEE